MKYCVILTVLLSLSFTRTLAEVPTLQNAQNFDQDNINPLNDPDQDLTDNDQDKRTICSALNGFRCGGLASKTPKQILFKAKPGYAYVRPVAGRPGGYKYTKPKIPLTITAPSAVKPVIGGWKPVAGPAKPVTVSVLKPSTPVDVIHSNPVPHVDHVQAGGTPAHIHFQPGHVHFQPVAIQGAHVDHVHQIQVPHGGHYDTLTHVDHIHQVPAAPLYPVVPAPAPVPVVKPFVQSAILFEVTKPNLGVLPLGARFHTPVLRDYPHIHFKPAAVPVAHVPVAPAPVAVPWSPAPVPVTPSAVVPTPVLPAPAPILPQPSVQGILQTPVGLPAIAPQPGVSVEYHGTRNYLPLAGALPLVPHVHQHAVSSAPAVPHLHASHLSVPHLHASPASVPHLHAAHGFIPQQQLPHNHQAHFLPQQQLPFETPQHFLQQQAQQFQQYPEIPQQQLPLEGEQEQYLPNPLNLQTFDQSNVIQPGHTDLQVPYHLPQHQAWQGAEFQQSGYSEEASGYDDQQQVFRPSAALEPPYVK